MHYGTDPCRPPKNSQAKASKAKPAPAKGKSRNGDASRPSRGGGSPATDSPVVIIHHRVKDLSPEGVAAIAEGIRKKRGRPPTGFDKKEHDRRKSAERRARLKAGK
jgi:hypothetical protein